MAIIYQKITGNSLGNDCLILGPREALVYPFNMGNWTEIRLGGFFSYTDAGNTNGTGMPESFSKSGPASSFFWGIKDTGSNLPYSSGATFFGISNDSVGGPKSVLVNDFVSTFPYIGTSDAGNNPVSFFQFLSGDTQLHAGVQLNGGTYYALRATQGVFVSGLTGYAWFNGLRYRYDRNRSIMTGNAMQDSAPSSDISINTLRSNLSTLPGQSASAVSSLNTGLFNPNAIFLYNPLINNAIRIHSLAVDKYQ